MEIETNSFDNLMPEINKEKLKKLITELQGEGTQKSLAKKLNVAPYTISSWINKVSSPSREKLDLIADYMGVSLDILMSKITDNSNIYSNKNIPTTPQGFSSLLDYHLSKEQQLELAKLILNKYY
ncbi:helix-turn-helix transcriptional regulator [Cyanobacterium aponinum AL20118]|uniref:Helix-turn-helix transcriptional regulator n=1 Tax=Cyanobacterium aponinum AL20115 TaxID=3090662 RepID=A0AAF1C161_9CHRO|nr:helix-turn-helix transcriptional regulator [Cyanobacterium aponinum]WPF87323.1 helix-turn-helix transcriptional regulator [Cyanobacterium aponinum AL20115]